MRLLILLPAILLPTASASSADPEPQATAGIRIFNPNFRSAESCPPTSRYQAMQTNRRPEVQKLNELPAADMYKSVYRQVDGCGVPIIAGYNIGGKR